MVQFLTPTALALMALAIPILLLWMLKLRRKDVPVSSTMLWSKLLRDREANAPWQRLRRNLLLFLQLLILAALVLVLARPFLPVPAVATGSVVLLLDASASMNATDVSPSRFAAAQRAAEEMIRGLGGDGVMTVIAVGSQPQILAAATGDKTVLRDAVAAAQPEQAPADWAPAFALAAGAISGATDGTIVILSDGNLPADLPPLPGDVHYIPIGREGGTENLAITALAAREGSGGLELFVNIANTSPREANPAYPLISFYLDGMLYESRRVQVEAGENLALTLTDLPADLSVIEARLAIEDALELDNIAWAVAQPGGERKALVVSPGNLFLERAIASLPEINAFRASPDQTLPSELFDLLIVDGLFPADLPASPLLLINPPPGNPLLTVSGVFSDTQLSRVSQSALLDYVDFSQVQIRQAQRVEVPAWAQVLIDAEGGPLLLLGEPEGRRVAVLTFDLHNSDLPLQVAFPVLIANLIEWLTPGLPFDAGDNLHPGEPLTLYPGDVSAVRIERPDGSDWTAVVGEGTLVFAGTEQTGLYRVALDDEIAGQFAVNLFDPAESDLARREMITVGRAEIVPSEEQELGQRELWPWLAAVALLVLLIEWWVFHRGTRFPRKKGPQEGF